MKPSLSEMLASFRTRRERRLIEAAMRAAPRPAPPEGLKQRLIEEALAAGLKASSRPKRSLARVIWAASAVIVALAVAASWFAWSGGQDVKQVKRLPAPHTKPMNVVQHAPPPSPEKQKQEIVQQKPSVKRKMVAQGGAIRKHRPKSGGGVKPVGDTPPMTVTVGRADTKTIRYAQAAAWGVDDDGRPVKTQWTLVDDPRSRVSREQLTKTDASGRAVLVVAVVTPSDDGNLPKGDRL